MSEFLEMRHGKVRRKLLTTASALVLTISIYSVDEARADDTDRPPLWIELGGQFEQSRGQGDPFSPPFISTYDWSAQKLTSPAAIQTINTFSHGEEASISFEPSGSDWVFSASIRYGRSNGTRHVHDQPLSPKLPIIRYNSQNQCCVTSYYTSKKFNFEDTKATKSEAHAIMDFQAGKDFGLGMFGSGSTSIVSAGVRIAQFHSRATVVANARENTEFYNYFPPAFQHYFPNKYLPGHHHSDFAISGQNARSFQGIGPSLNWKASAPFIGGAERGEVTFDWGVNAALLFGRQKVSGHHQTTAKYHKQKQGPYVYTPLYQTNVPMTRERTVMVPNVGGMAGLSVHYSNAKISLGYRADFFFGAMDGGVDTRKSETRGFYGPFAKISVGLGG